MEKTDSINGDFSRIGGYDLKEVYVSNTSGSSGRLLDCKKIICTCNDIRR